MIDPSLVKTILLRMPNWIGDCVMATSVLPLLKKMYPAASISAFCKEPLQDLLKYNPYLDAVIAFTNVNKKKTLHQLKHKRYDLGILLTNSFSSAWDFFQMRVKYRQGFSTDCRRFLLTHPVQEPLLKKKQHLVKTYQQLLDPHAATFSGPLLWIHPNEWAALEAFLQSKNLAEKQDFIGINPGAAYGLAKCWMPERFQEVITKLSIQFPTTTFLIFGDASTQSTAQKIAQGLESCVVDLTGQTDLRLLMLLMKKCRAILTNDSGPMHMADSLKVPCVALFGSTDPIVTGPFYGQQVLYKKAACSPCFLRTCPIDFRCMEAISVEEVLNTIQKVGNLC